jgi:glycosyltransferase involved in cell wall biosynthesis
LIGFANVVPFQYRIPGPWLLRAWQHLNFPPLEALMGGFDVFHAMASIAPPRLGGKCVLTVHDLYFKIKPEHCDTLGGLYLEKTFERSLRRADAIIAVSNATKRDLLRFYPDLPAHKARVVYEGVDPRLKPVDDQERLRLFRSEFCLPEVYILTVSTLEPRKNLPGLFQSYAALKRLYAHPPPLVVVGVRGWKSAGIFHALEDLKLEVGRDVVFTDYVPHKHMPLIFAAARLFVFPTLHEGFGLPLLEAMASGAPAVASSVDALREIGGDAALFVDPNDPEGMARAIKSLLVSGERRREMRQRGLETAKRFTWKLAARKTLRVYEEVTSGRMKDEG